MKLSLNHDKEDEAYITVRLNDIPFPTGEKYVVAGLYLFDPIVPRDFPEALRKLADLIDKELTLLEEAKMAIEKDYEGMP